MPAAVSSITRQTVGRTFIVAITILGAFALAQIGAIGWLFCARFHLQPAPVSFSKTASPNLQGTPQTKDFTDPFAEAALPTAVVSPAGATPPPPPPRPAPVSSSALTRLAVPSEPTVEDRITEALDQGRILRDRGDTYAAVTKLREAEAYDQTNPAPKAELAMTFEKMGHSERAAECWKQIYDMGEAAGVYYAAAKGKLDAVKSEALRHAEPAPAPSAASPQAESVGLGAASRLGFETITRTEENDPQSIERFVLHVPIRGKARARIDPGLITVKVLLFDLVNGRQLDTTKANVVKKWADSPPDWSERSVETLDIVFARPFTPQGEPAEDRKYYGYIASVYYKNALQDFRSEPPTLAQQSPPPRTLPEASP
jgi:hypothetical protein